MASSTLATSVPHFPSRRGFPVTQSPHSPSVSFSPVPRRLHTARSKGGASCGGGRLIVKAMSDTTKKKYMGTHAREKHLEEMIEKKVTEAKEVCEGDVTSDDCKVAWDEVEEVSHAKADLRWKMQVSQGDPLEAYCQENPETDECRIYED